MTRTECRDQVAFFLDLVKVRDTCEFIAFAHNFDILIAFSVTV